MNTPGFDNELLPYAESCLTVMALFLNLLWAALLAAWAVARIKYPTALGLGAKPGKPLIAVAAFVWAVSFGVALFELAPQYWFLGFAIANGAFLAVLNPAFSICFSFAMLFTRPWELMPPNVMMLEIPRFSMLFTLAWAMFFLAVVDRFSLRLNRYILLLLAYTGWVFLSTFVAEDQAQAGSIFKESMVRALIIGLLIHHLIRDRFSFWSLRATVIAMFTCAGVLAIMLYFSGYRDEGRLQVFGVLKNSNDIAAVMLILIVLSVGPFISRQALGTAADRVVEKLAALVPVGVGVVTIALAQSRGAIVALGAAAGLHFLRNTRHRLVAVLTVVLLTGATYGATTVLSRADTDLAESKQSRISFWISGMRMTLYNPVLGVGLGQFPKNFEKYATEIVGEYGRRTAHSSWILAFAETGVLGGLLFMAMYTLGSIGSAMKLRRFDPTWLYAGVAYGVAMTFLSHTQTMFPYILMGMTTVAESISRAAPTGSEGPVL